MIRMVRVAEVSGRREVARGWWALSGFGLKPGWAGKRGGGGGEGKGGRERGGGGREEVPQGHCRGGRDVSRVLGQDESGQ